VAVGDSVVLVVCDSLVLVVSGSDVVSLSLCVNGGLLALGVAGVE
jgi:hypothetical protein